MPRRGNEDIKDRPGGGENDLRSGEKENWKGETGEKERKEHKAAGCGQPVVKAERKRVTPELLDCGCGCYEGKRLFICTSYTRMSVLLDRRKRPMREGFRLSFHPRVTSSHRFSPCPLLGRPFLLLSRSLALLAATASFCST